MEYALLMEKLATRTSVYIDLVVILLRPRLDLRCRREYDPGRIHPDMMSVFRLRQN
jgi:hypothetical protein